MSREGPVLWEALTMQTGAGTNVDFTGPPLWPRGRSQLASRNKGPVATAWHNVVTRQYVAERTMGNAATASQASTRTLGNTMEGGFNAFPKAPARDFLSGLNPSSQAPQGKF